MSESTGQQLQQEPCAPKKTESYFIHVLRSNYCKIVFALGLVAGWFLVPESAFSGWMLTFALVFIFVFAMTITCLIRSVKERVILEKENRGSIWATIAAGVGLTALHVCGVSAPVCGASVGLGIVSAIIPGFAMQTVSEYGVYIVGASILIQAYALYNMKCFSAVARCGNGK